MITRAVNIHREDCDVYVGRPSMFGNPYRAGATHTRYEVIEKYRQWFLGRLRDPEFRAAAEALRGKRLGCSCKPKLCHADVIAAWCNGELPEPPEPKTPAENLDMS